MYWMGSRYPPWEEAFFWGKGRPIVTYRDTLWSSVQKRLNRSKCCLSYGLGWAQGIVLDGGPQMLRDVVMATNFWLSIRYDFGCMIASDTLFDSSCGFLGSSYLMKT